MFKACCDAILQNQGMSLHACISNMQTEFDVTLGNTLIAMYAKSRRLEDAIKILEQMPKQDIVSWNVLLSAYVQHGSGCDAFVMYGKLQKQRLEPDEVTFISLLQACACTEALSKGSVIHLHILECSFESTLFINNALIDMYGKCGSMRDALAVFTSVAQHDVITWNTLIACYILHKEYSKALEAYTKMQEDGTEPDDVTFVSMLQVCSSLMLLVYGMLIHACIILAGINMDIYVNSCLFEMYVKCESFEDGDFVRGSSQRKDTTISNLTPTMNSMGSQDEELTSFLLQESLAGSVNGCCKLLKACSIMNALDIGRHVHCNVVETVCDFDMQVGNALVDMYAKCGSIQDAYSVLCKMQKRDAVTWTTLISGSGHYMDYQFAVQCYEEMVKEGIDPVETTYVCLLTACSRAGEWKEGCRYFESMMKQHELTPISDHFYCMIDLFGRSGKLIEADDILQTIPLSCPGVVAYRTFLNHCKSHKN
ncbi:hypothetical protein KP509_14G004700 [Ceratopteris richardii]|nr:hypothetical protein KP509_14G004700 [Ceratopteris richardii]